MRKTLKKQLLNTRFTIFLTMVTAFFASPLQASEVKVCAVPQVYGALEALHEISPVDYSTRYGTANDILSWITNAQEQCDLVISSDEKLPILLIRAQMAQPASLHSFIRAPLLLWSADPRVLDSSLKVIREKKLKSLCVPRAELTPVGFATKMILAKKEFPTSYLEGKIYRADQEYQCFSLIKSATVQSGFITKPLVMKSNGRIEGSYWQVPRELYPDILYYEIVTEEGSSSRETEIFYNLIKSNKKVQNIFTQAGFEPLSPRSDFVPPAETVSKESNKAESKSQAQRKNQRSGRSSRNGRRRK